MNARQRGFNLISLMVGTVLSLVSILAMLSLYRNLIATSVVATQDARQDGQVASARLIVQRDLQSAGYGIEDAAVGTDFVLLSGATLEDGSLTGSAATLPGSGNAVLWHYETGTPQCAGFLADSSGALYRLEATSCSGNLATLDWTGIPVLAAPPGTGALDAATFHKATDDAPFSVAYADCWPYQKSADSLASHLQVTFGSNLTASTAGTSTYAAANRSVTCLPNIADPSS